MQPEEHYMDYFMEEISHSEMIITEGDLEGGVDHLIKTIVECNQPEKLLGFLQETLPEEVLALLVYKLVNYNAKTKRLAIERKILRVEADADSDDL